MKTTRFILKRKEEEYKIALEICWNCRNKNKFYYHERVIIACNIEGIVTFENFREFVQQLLSAQIFCGVQDSSSNISMLNEW